MIIIRLFWEFPQCLIAGIIWLWLWASRRSPTGRRNSFGGVTVTFDANPSEVVFTGVGLGPYAFVSKLYQGRSEAPRAVQGNPDAMIVVEAHEAGHTRQSLFLGPLYLLLIGLPSVLMNMLTRMRVLRRDRYYARWPENWADKLGGVGQASIPSK